MATAVKNRIQLYYRTHDYNCAETTLRILSEAFDVRIQGQVLDAAVGMHGAGLYGAQCGLVEGALMFIGIAGRLGGKEESEIIGNCRRFAENFEKGFGSLICRELRPEGFSPDNPPHICEKLTGDVILFDIDFMAGLMDRNPRLDDHVGDNPEGESHE